MTGREEWTARQLDDERRIFEAVRLKHPNRRRSKSDGAWRRTLDDYR